ncbi:MAG: hypothetical protein AB1758_30350, partial [Candidatus Eremiobacterota bacterium]
MLLMALVLFTLLKALIVISHGNAFRSKAYQDRVSAGYALEAAVADAMAQLELNPAWTVGFDSKKLLHASGTYTVRFVDPAVVTPGPDDSVNNLAGTGTVAGPRGPNSVPAGCVDMVVIAHAGGVERRAEVFLTGSSTSTVTAGILASNRIMMQGNVDVRGITDLETGLSTDVNLHSNAPGSAADVVTWKPIDATDTATIQGTVSATSTSAAAVSAAGALISGGIRINEPAKPAPTVDIAGTISANSGMPNPGLPGTGSKTLTAGSYYVAGNVSMQGDLDLKGAKLYVNGDLNINGSLSGEGEVYAAGKTTLKGDVNLTSENGVALYSKGSVELSGFDGTEYLEAFCAGDPQAAALATEARTALTNLQNLVATTPITDIYDCGYAHDTFDALIDELGGWDSGASSTGNYDVLGKLADRLEAAQPTPSPTRDFVLGKLRDLRRLCADETGNDPERDWRDGTNQEPGVLLCSSHSDMQVFEEVLAAVSQYDCDKLGSTIFQGSIYTNGYIYASNDVTVVGAVYSTSDGTQPGATLDGTDVKPGDIFLNQGVRLTLNEKTIQDLGGGAGPITTG